MPFVFVALAGYFLNAVASTVDKFLLSEGRIGSPALYAFGNGLTSVPFLALFPFGFVLLVPSAVGSGIASGMFLFFAIFTMYLAVKRSEVSRAAPLVGVSGLGFLFLLSLFFSVSAGRPVSPVDMLAIAMLAGGGFLLTGGGQAVRGKGFVPIVLASGALFGLSLLLFRNSSLSANFVTALVWSKVGMVLGSLALLAVPASRKGILSGHERFSGPAKRSVGTGGVFLLNQGIGGLGTILVSYAVSLGSATFVQGLSGVQYGFVFIFATALSIRFPDAFRERYGRRDIAMKVVALALLALGIRLAVTGGTLDGFL